MPDRQKFLEDILFTLIFSFLFLSSSLVMVGMYIRAYRGAPVDSAVRTRLSDISKKNIEAEPEVIGDKDTEGFLNNEIVLKVGKNGNFENCDQCLENGTSFVDDIEQGNSLEFDGSSYIDITNVITLGSSSEFTLKFLIKPDFDERSKEWKYIYSDSGSVQVFYMSNLNDFRLFLRTDKGIYRVDTKELNWEPEVWYELGVTYDGDTAKIFWDGVKVAEGTARGNISSKEGNVLFGISQSTDNGFTGLVSGVEISKEASDDKDMSAR
jgi:hypothetical protein